MNMKIYQKLIQHATAESVSYVGQAGIFLETTAIGYLLY